jgi:hypothetical protein
MKDLTRPTESKLIETNEQGVDLYQPGLPAVSAAKATLLSFLPGSVLSLAAILLPLPGTTLSNFLGDALITLVPLSLGFWLGIESMRRWLYPDAGLVGRRSVIAGVMSCACVAILLLITRGMPLAPAMASIFVIGLVVAFLMFFAWLSPTPEDQRPLSDSSSTGSAS